MKRKSLARGSASALLLLVLACNAEDRRVEVGDSDASTGSGGSGGIAGNFGGTGTGAMGGTGGTGSVVAGAGGGGGTAGSGVTGGAAGSGSTAGTVGTGATGGTSDAGSTGGTGATGGTSSSGGTGGGSAGSSCQGLTATCGPTNESCCESPLVPGGTFLRSYDGVQYTDQSYPATVSSFRLDKYEITVGRFRKFVAAYSPTMISAGAGKNPKDPNDPGWLTDWNVTLPLNTAAFTTALKCDPGIHTWTDSPGANETKPINCITWYEAFAFCTWDGGRLPSEAEWNFAAAGGSEQRVFPWSNPPNSTVVDASYAVYLPSGVPSVVGSKGAKAQGRWGHADLAGNLYEWAVDSKVDYITPCNDCANTYTLTSQRVIRGGSFFEDVSKQLVSYRAGHAPQFPRINHFGARCARNP